MNCMYVLLCPSLCSPMNCSSAGSSVHGVSQARVLEQVAISFPTQGSNLHLLSPALAGRFFTTVSPEQPQIRHVMFYQFQACSIMIWYLYILRNDHNQVLLIRWYLGKQKKTKKPQMNLVRQTLKICVDYFPLIHPSDNIYSQKRTEYSLRVIVFR